MGTVALRPMQVKGNWFTSGGMEQYVDTQFVNKASEVFKAGELVCVDATPEVLRFATIVGTGDDRVDVSALNPSPLTLAATLLKPYGIALVDAPASGQITIPIAVIYPGTLVEGNLVTATSGDGDAPAALALAATHLLAPVAIVFDDTADRYYFTPSIATTAERCADIVKIGLGVGGGGTQDAYGMIGDYNCRVQCTVRHEILRTFCNETVAGTT